MYFKWLKKVGSVILAFAMVIGTPIAIPVSAAENIEIVLTDITKDDQTTLLGEAKIKVSVKGAGGNVTAVQVALEFDGELKYKSIDFMQGENNPPECLHIAPNAALANTTGKILPSITTNNAGSMTFTDDMTDLFIITFSGNPGDSVTVSLNNESAAGSYVRVDGEYINAADSDAVSKSATASSVANEGVSAAVKLVMDKVDDFTVSTGNGYADSKITLTITNETTGSTISTVLNTVSSTKGGHYDSSSSIPTFIVENTVVSGDTYTVELSGKGYVTKKLTGVDFSETVEFTNADFVPGDVNSDGKVDSTDKAAYEEVKSGNYDNYEKDYADFNRDGKVDNYDDVFDEMESETKTVPDKMSAPVVTGGKKKITVSWTAPDNGGSEITGYTIKYGTSSSDLNKTVEITNASSTSKDISGLSAETTYYVQIAAKNEMGLGEFSATANAETDTAENAGESGGSATGGGGGGAGGGGGGGYTPTVPMTPTTPTTPVTPSDSNEIFTDLGNYAWAKDSIYTLKNKGIISGVSQTEYAPASNIKRGDFILILTRMLSIEDSFTENFADVPVSSYYYNAIGSAKVAGIAQGSGENFMPENTITRQDLITLSYRAFLAKGYITETDDLAVLDSFADKDNISDYAKTAMASMVKAGIIQGSDGCVNPLGNATRAEVAVMCARLAALMN